MMMIRKIIQSNLFRVYFIKPKYSAIKKMFYLNVISLFTAKFLKENPLN